MNNEYKVKYAIHARFSALDNLMYSSIYKFAFTELIHTRIILHLCISFKVVYIISLFTRALQNLHSYGIYTYRKKTLDCTDDVLFINRANTLIIALISFFHRILKLKRGFGVKKKLIVLLYCFSFIAGKRELKVKYARLEKRERERSYKREKPRI